MAVGGLVLLTATWAVVAWLVERRHRNIFPASQARALLNPLRRWIMPVGATLERVDIRPGQTVLEVGPGPGYYSIEASRMLGPKGRLVCLDIQRGMLDVLAGRLAGAGADNAGLVVADAMHLPLAAASVDRAFLVTVLGEVPDPDAALAELRRVLRPGGLIGFSESLGDPDIVFLGKLRNLCGRHGLAEVASYRNPLGYTAVFRAPTDAMLQR